MVRPTNGENLAGPCPRTVDPPVRYFRLAGSILIRRMTQSDCMTNAPGANARLLKLTLLDVDSGTAAMSYSDKTRLYERYMNRMLGVTFPGIRARTNHAAQAHGSIRGQGNALQASRDEPPLQAHRAGHWRSGPHAPWHPSHAIVSATSGQSARPRRHAARTKHTRRPCTTATTALGQPRRHHAPLESRQATNACVALVAWIAP